MFVAVTVTAAATGPEQLKLGSARLLSRQVHYDSYKIAGGMNASPGFQVSADTLFEVDLAQIDDLALRRGLTRSSRVISNGYGSSSVLRRPTPSDGAQRPEISGIEISPSHDEGHPVKLRAAATHSLCRRGVRGRADLSDLVGDLRWNSHQRALHRPPARCCR